MTVVESVRLGLRPLLDETRPTCTQTNNVGQITSLTTPQGHMHCRIITVDTTWLPPKGSEGVCGRCPLLMKNGKWSFFMRDDGGGVEDSGGSGWLVGVVVVGGKDTAGLKTWAACRSAPVSSESKEKG